jgi:hypothetical protein
MAIVVTDLTAVSLVFNASDMKNMLLQPFNKIIEA